MVEIDPDVIALRESFGVPDDKRLAIVQANAAAYLPAAEGDTDVLLLDGFDSKGIAPAFLSRSFYRAAHNRLRPGGIGVANFAGPRKYWSRHLALLNEAFEGRVQVGTVPGGDNHIAFAFADAGFPLDWQLLEKRAGQLAERSPLDFFGHYGQPSRGAELRWAKAAAAKASLLQKIQVTETCRKSTLT